jgi:hypothetical protein
MVRGKALISWAHATDLAGRCCAANDRLSLDPVGELLAHDRGWIWAVYFTEGKARTHFALIHSDGTPLARAVADEVIASDRACGGSLHALSCLNPAPSSVGEPDPTMLAAYAKYLADECGFIQLDGLPADADVGSRRLRLENLFVPLHLDVTKGSGTAARQAVGAALDAHPRLAILAPPGGGKSTLLKRLATAYADPTRRQEIADDLANRDWFPLFFRCRELRDLARGSFADMVRALSEREGIRPHAAAFRAQVDRLLLAGKVLLLVDGLDEISDAGDRATFVSTLRSALQAYPGTAFVVTSREAGFRHVAAHLAPVCTRATLSPFDEADIHRLCRSWHREVVGDTEKVRADADHLAESILRANRIRQLAVNPLLLTTLLLVKRWVGTLPTRRAVLYGKAVEVLLMTWNTEGHAPIPEEEALPQLCFVASAMMFDGVQKISRPRLAARLREARAALPTELGYVQGSIEEFIHRVEDRSSLLIMTGHDVEDGRLVEFFEFRHLTFQEYLTARAVVEGWHPGRQESDTLATVLEPHFGEEEWREVIPLAAVLGGKATEALIRRLTALLGSALETRLPDEGSKPGKMSEVSALRRSLGSCLADEAAARPETIRAALRELVRVWGLGGASEFGPLLARSKYGSDLLAEARELFFTSTGYLRTAGLALADVAWAQTAESERLPDPQGVGAYLRKLISNSTGRDRCEAALYCMNLFYEMSRLHSVPAELTKVVDVGPLLAEMLTATDTSQVFAAAWALAWLGECQIWLPPAEPDLLGRLFELGRSHPEPKVRRMAWWALSSQPLASRDDPRRLAGVTPDELKVVVSTFEGDDDRDSVRDRREIALLVIAWYKRMPWSDAELAARASEARQRFALSRDRFKTFRELCRRLGVEEEAPASG